MAREGKSGEAQLLLPGINVTCVRICLSGGRRKVGNTFLYVWGFFFTTCGFVAFVIHTAPAKMII